MNSILMILAYAVALTIGVLIGRVRRKTAPLTAGALHNALQVDSLGELGMALETRRLETGATRQQMDKLLDKGKDAAFNMEKNRVRYNAFLLPIQYARLLGFDSIVINLKTTPTHDPGQRREPNRRLQRLHLDGGADDTTAGHHPQ